MLFRDILEPPGKSSKAGSLASTAPSTQTHSSGRTHSLPAFEPFLAVYEPLREYAFNALSDIKYMIWNPKCSNSKQPASNDQLYCCL